MLLLINCGFRLLVCFVVLLRIVLNRRLLSLLELIRSFRLVHLLVLVRAEWCCQVLRGASPRDLLKQALKLSH